MGFELKDYQHIINDGVNVETKSADSCSSKQTRSKEKYVFIFSKYQSMIEQCIVSYFGTNIYKDVFNQKIKNSSGSEEFFISVLIDFLIMGSLKDILNVSYSKLIKDNKLNDTISIPYFDNLTNGLNEIYGDLLSISRSLKSLDLIVVSRDIKDAIDIQNSDEIPNDIVKLVDEFSSTLQTGGIVGVGGGVKVETLKPSMPPEQFLNAAIDKFCFLTSMPRGIAYSFVNNGYTHGINLKMQIYEQDTFYTIFYQQFAKVLIYLKNVFNLDFAVRMDSRVDSIDKLLLKYTDLFVVLNQLTYISDEQKVEITKILLTPENKDNEKNATFNLKYEKPKNEKQYNTKNKRI